jgi:hypothetical protein
MLANDDVVHGSENHLYLALQVIGRAYLPHSPSMVPTGIGTLPISLGSLPRCPHPGSPCCHVPLESLAHH